MQVEGQKEKLLAVLEQLIVPQNAITKRKGDNMPRIYDKVCRKYFTVSSKVKVGKVGSPRWRAYCARSAKIKGGQGRCSKNQAQRRRWKC